MIVIIDTSALLEWLLRTPRAAAVDAYLRESGAMICAPHSLDLEVVETLHLYVESGQISKPRALEALEDLQSLRIFRYGHEPYLPRIWELRGSTSAGLAAFLALAETLSVPLLTCDSELAEVAGHQARVVVL